MLPVKHFIGVEREQTECQPRAVVADRHPQRACIQAMSLALDSDIASVEHQNQLVSAQRKVRGSSSVMHGCYGDSRIAER